MWKSNLIIALRMLGRNKTISLINIAGLSAAFAVAVLCLLFVRHETSFDTWHEKRDRIFIIYRELIEPKPGSDFNRSTMTGYSLREDLRTKVTGIRESVSMRSGYGQVSYGDANFGESFLAVDPAFLTMFTLPLAAGDAATALDGPQSVVLAHETARKYFGPRCQPTPWWASASGCGPSSGTTRPRHRRRRPSRWSVPSQECWHPCRGIPFCG